MTLHEREVRSHFPALASPTVFLDNAGGSQVPRVVADALRAHMLERYVQLGADYEVSRRATAMVEETHAFLKVFMNAATAEQAESGKGGLGEVVIGPSTSQLCRMLADCYADAWRNGDQVIVCETAHESNRGPWRRVERAGGVVAEWKVDPRTGEASMDELKRLLTRRTRLVAFPQVSNILGEIVDVAAIAKIAHEAGARVVVDGVAFAPHRAIDVAAWKCDWYVYSTYKVFGPHAAVLFGTHESFAELTGPNHSFIDRADLPKKFELGGANHESCAGILALGEYLAAITGESACSRGTVERAMASVTETETALQRPLLAFLSSHPRVRVIGPAHSDPSRVCTIGFRHSTLTSKEIALACNRQHFGMRYGNFYAHRLCEAMGISPEDGVVRISLAHYNTKAEVERLIGALTQIL